MFESAESQLEGNTSESEATDNGAGHVRELLPAFQWTAGDDSYPATRMFFMLDF